jgi:tetratricopeptide (TPR) repeat protein
MRLNLIAPIKLTLLFTAISVTLGAVLHPPMLGTVHFQTSCNADVRVEFDQAVALLHSFEFTEAEQRFGQVEHQDPKCVIAAWGMAVAETERAGANAPPKILAAGWTQLQPWLSMKAQTTREQLYVDAVRSMYEGFEQTSGEERWNRYLARMSAIRREYPTDTNASLFYALGLVWTSGPGPNGIARRHQALEILLPIFQAYPDNPGAAHYIIHAADTPELAAMALPAARKYATIAPDSPHALHMPSHIFSRLGYWREMVSSNQDSARVAADWVKEGRDGRFDEVHALTYLEYAYLQLGEHDRAREQITRLRDLMMVPGGDPWAEIDGRILYDVQTSEWQDAVKIEAPTSSPVQDNFDVYWIHTIAAAHLGRLGSARSALRDLSDSIARQKSGSGYANTLHLYLLQAESAVESAEGQPDKAITILKSAISF